MIGAILFVFLASAVGFNIPHSPVGHSIGNPQSSVHIDMFIDWQCSNSMYSYGTLQKVIQYFANKIHFTLYVTHIWHFRQSADLAIAVQIISQANKIGKYSPAFWPLAQFIFDHQDEWWNSQQYYTPEAAFVQSVATYAAQNFGVSNTTFYADFNKGESGNGQIAAMTEVRHAILAGVSTTPTFRTNGFIDNSVNEFTTFDQWVTYINTLLTASEKEGL